MVLPELFICGYPPEDLVLKPAFQAACRAAVEELARETADGGPAMLIGTPWVEDGKLYNACACSIEGRIAALRYKANLPNYGVFDEKRLFARGPAAGPVTVKGIRVGVPICEDIWLEESEEYENIVECLAETGAEILVVPNGSPYARDKNDMRLSIAVARVTESGLPLIYLNQIGGQDELVFDGASFALNADSRSRRNCLRSRRASPRCAGPRAPTAGAATGRWRRWSKATRAIMRRACWACETMSARTDFPACCSASPVASIPRSARRSRSTRSAPNRSAA